MYLSILDNELSKQPILWVVQAGLTKKALGLNQFLIILNPVTWLQIVYTNLIVLYFFFMSRLLSSLHKMEHNSGAKILKTL